MSGPGSVRSPVADYVHHDLAPMRFHPVNAFAALRMPKQAASPGGFHRTLRYESRDEKKPHISAGFFHITSLTITYFHTGCSTIIGAKSFHGPVRDGKGWDRLAMVIRHNLYAFSSRRGNCSLNLEEVLFSWVSCFNKHSTLYFLPLYLLRL